AHFILELVNTEGWLNFIGDRNIRSIEAAEAYIERINNNNDITYWTVYLRDTDTAVGIITLIQRDYLDHKDIGFAFLPEYSGKKYAFEATQVVIEFLVHEPLLAVTIPDNHRSINLLNKLGFSFSHQVIQNDKPLDVYKMK
ncbi:MAG: GNAT family N-acetyltransferase, partial [Chitinophagaceae bacterium]|nr:GNAT family N-acetyltransferase [Chitinophagaceae bacterium]